MENTYICNLRALHLVKVKIITKNKTKSQKGNFTRVIHSFRNAVIRLGIPAKKLFIRVVLKQAMLIRSQMKNILNIFKI